MFKFFSLGTEWWVSFRHSEDSQGRRVTEARIRSQDGHDDVVHIGQAFCSRQDFRKGSYRKQVGRLFALYRAAKTIDWLDDTGNMAYFLSAFLTCHASSNYELAFDVLYLSNFTIDGSRSKSYEPILEFCMRKFACRIYNQACLAAATFNPLVYHEKDRIRYCGK